jgi:DNA-binding transcriptional MerR regulator
MHDFGIGRLAELTGVKVPTIRFYEQIGLLPAPLRTGGGQRRYDFGVIARLTFIRHARDLGFDVDEVRELLRLADNPDASCKTVDEIARHQVGRIDAKMKRLRAMRRELVAVIQSCRGPHIRDCRILEVLAEVKISRSERTSAPGARRVASRTVPPN